MPGYLKIAQKIKTILMIFKRVMSFLANFQGIVFFGGYPYSECINDEYFIRIKTIDEIFTDQQRIYFDKFRLPERQSLFDEPDENVFVIRMGGNWIRNIVSRIFLFLFVLKSKYLYFHSLYSTIDLPRPLNHYKKTRIIDCHRREEDVYSEEMMQEDGYIRIERQALLTANIIIVISDRMRQYYQKKFNGEIEGHFIVIPNLSKIDWEHMEINKNHDDLRVVYAGGLQKWHEVPMMIDALAQTLNRFSFSFFCPNPSEFRKLLPHEVKNTPSVVEDKSNDKILDELHKSHFGFFLREDSIVTHIACPMKLTDYLAMGVIPIIISREIGDFQSLGMQSIILEDFLDGHIPDQRFLAEMVHKNREVYRSLVKTFEKGVNELREYIPFEQIDKSKQNSLNFTIEPCDILVQVGNFLSGGLENVVLGINEILMDNGHKVGLLILGDTGSAVDRAKDSGAVVYIRKFDEFSYTELIKSLSPKLLLAHYSVEGAKICNDLGIPFLQVIHSVYLWFTKGPLAASFQNSFSYTNIFIAVSEYAKDFSVRRLGVPVSKCIVIPNGIDIHRIREIIKRTKRSALRKKYHFSSDDFIFLNVTAIADSKNNIGLVKAFFKALTNCPQAKLMLIGPVYSEEKFSELTAFIDHFDLHDRIIYLGQVEEAYRYYVMADAFVIPSFVEGGPLVLLEALAFNLPIITTSVGFAEHFKNVKGVDLIPPPIDIFNYKGTTSELSSTDEFETILSESIQKTYKDPIKPNISKNTINLMDKRIIYDNYLRIINMIIAEEKKVKDICLSLWTDHLKQ